MTPEPHYYMCFSVYECNFLLQTFTIISIFNLTLCYMFNISQTMVSFALNIFGIL